MTVYGGLDVDHTKARWWDNGWPQVNVPDTGFLSREVGSRAYRYLIIEARRGWPPGLEDWETAMLDAGRDPYE